MRPAVANVLSRHKVEPVLVDVGASGSPPAVWMPLAPASTYVGFDPDRREIHEEESSVFRRSVIVPLAVTALNASETTDFYLTRSPFCSSTLEPDAQSLEAYLFSDLFEVERKVSVRASTLRDALAFADVDRADWIKSDSQGTDLRVVQSLGSELLAHVLAIDVEPGLIDAYRGEDLFPVVHSEMTKNGFWISHAAIRGTPRMRRVTADAYRERLSLNVQAAARSVRESPGWIEARYLRTPESLEGSSDREHILLWAFAIADTQLGFALDVASDYERRFGRDDVWETMASGAADALRKRSRRRIPRRLVALGLRAMGRRRSSWPERS